MEEIILFISNWCKIYIELLIVLLVFGIWVGDVFLIIVFVYCLFLMNLKVFYMGCLICLFLKEICLEYFNYLVC